MKTVKPHIEYIEWEDAISNSSWKTEEETIKWMKGTRSVIGQLGWILRDDEKYIGMASRQDMTSNGDIGDQWGQLQLIPKTWIRRRVKIKI